MAGIEGTRGGAVKNKVGSRYCQIIRVSKLMVRI